MNDFTASNGRRISADSRSGIWLNESVIRISAEDADALREFFQAEADERIGRWRWPEKPDYVVYPRADHVAVVNEQSGNALQATRDQADINTGLCRAARAYFDAHPEPKPWHDAVEGEVWILMFSNSAHAWIVNGDYFQSAKTLTNIAKTDTGIISARRIYPEGES
ncbi:hypothetical protein [uncultured Microbacterium sp.]|uniref:hypothetical protein n=1 Tax=uncultured Microbacterium sp. TaxID=191216 RepID=UPI0025FB1EB2|nr:hypothetical protein [uncultured Microbacterium sp.]